MDFCKYNFSLMFGLCCKLHFLMSFFPQIPNMSLLFIYDNRERNADTFQLEISTKKFIFPPTSNINTLANREKTSDCYGKGIVR